MDIINRILGILADKGLKQADLCNYVGIKYNVFTTWKTRGTEPPTKFLIQICDFLGVSPYYLLTGEEKSPSLPEDELELLTYYKELPEREQMKLIGRASALAEVYKEQIEVETPMIEIRHSYYKVSAGTGYDLNDGDQWDTIEIPDTQEARRADFALTISGDSMEPVYYDGDIVLIKSQRAIDGGEIGIFIIENNGFIKKYGGDRLISLNAKYDDIMFSDYDPEDIRCVGLVIGRV